MKRLLALFALVAAFTAAGGVLASSANAADWNCSPGYCIWGHNYIGSGVNEVNQSPFNYWYDQYLHKHSGDWVKTTVWNSVCSNDVNRYGVNEWYVVISSFYGCGGYNSHILSWHSGFGNTSYLHIDTVT